VDGGGDTRCWAMAPVIENWPGNSGGGVLAQQHHTDNLAVVMEVFFDNGLRWRVIGKKIISLNNYWLCC